MSSTHGSGNTSSGRHHHNGRRIRQFLRPDGRRVHVAHNPEDAIKLKRHLETTNEPFDVYLHGSPEHLEALREVHGHHERRREELRSKHGDAYDEFEKVRLELDALSAELRAITEHGVALDANFSKYGYSAHLRTRADHADSSSNSILGNDGNGTGTGSSEKHDWEAERNNGYAIKFYRRPVVRQYFHKGLLWRAPESEEVASFELFVDLLYVGIIAVNGDSAAEHPTGDSLLRFCITFILSWKIWTDFTLIISWFESDDMFQRISVLFILACLVGYTVNVLESGHGTYTQMIAFFLAARIFGLLYFMWLTFVVPMIRATLIWNAVIIAMASALWIGSIHVHDPQRQALIWVAISLDVWGSMSILAVFRGAKHVSKRWGARMEKMFEFFPAVNIEHKTERTNAFVTLVFGYSVVALLYQNRDSNGIDSFYGKAVLGLMQAFAFNWIYFEIDGVNIYMHAIRRKIWSSVVWNTIHLPFIMSYVLGAAALSKLVIAHDCPNADAHHLTELWESRSMAELHAGIRWFYCVGLGLALACMGEFRTSSPGLLVVFSPDQFGPLLTQTYTITGIISLSHVHKDVAGARLRKSHRLAVRFVVAIILLCLPLAQHHLNSVELVAVVTALVWFVLIVDLYGLSKVGVKLFGRHGRCAYTAECGMRRKELEQAVKTGQTVNIEALAEKDLEGPKGLHV
ncbi:MAG: hypothetical protein M1816_001292 [Peltula sp. TS41687]|nr:MAG: hypothetical protein M1816_001292 [Peltula sp. TS41687]